MKWIVLNLYAYKKSKHKIPIHVNTWVILKIIVDYYKKHKEPIPMNLLKTRPGYYQFVNKLVAYRMVNKIKDGKYYYVVPTSAGIKRVEGLTYKDLIMQEYEKAKVLGYERSIRYIEERYVPINVIV